MRAGHKVLVDVDGNILLIVGDLEVILDIMTLIIHVI